MIKLILFDYFGVIGSEDYFEFTGEDKGLAEGKYHHLVNDVNVGRIGWQEFVEETSQRTGKDMVEVNKMFENNRINREVTGLISKLGKAYKVALLTNAHHDYIEKLIARAGLDELFDDVFISSRLGIIKPDRRIFEHAIGRFGIMPEEAVFIDDQQIHVTGAQQTGLYAILYENPAQLMEELNELKVQA